MMHRCYGIAALLWAAGMFAQAPSASPPPEQPPDVALTATARARELRFFQVPQVSVTFTGSINGVPNVTVWKTDRTNLPEQVQPHVTYRDIGIRLTITSTLPNIEQILDDALGPQSRPAPPPKPEPTPTPDPEHRKK